MSTDHNSMNPNWDQPPARPGMSTGTKVLIVLAIVFGVLVVLCCGGLTAMMYWGQQYMAEAISEDPATVQRATESIADIDIPDGLRPTASFNMKIPFTDESAMLWVVYGNEQNDSELVLGSFGGMFQEQDQAQMQRAFEDSLSQQGKSRQRELANATSTEREIEVRGQATTFMFTTGQDGQQRPRIHVRGTFEGKNGPVMLMFHGDPEKFPEDRIVEMIESIE